MAILQYASNTLAEGLDYNQREKLPEPNLLIQEDGRANATNSCLVVGVELVEA